MMLQYRRRSLTSFVLRHRELFLLLEYEEGSLIDKIASDYDGFMKRGHLQQKLDSSQLHTIHAWV